MYAVPTNVRDENGDSVIPASQRPDGTWRKARRVKEGYVPQEEVPLYESKGKQLQNKQVTVANQLPPGQVAHKSIPGLFIQESADKAAPVKSKNKKKTNKDTSVAQITEQLKELKIVIRPAAKPAKAAPSVPAQPAKTKSVPDQQTATDPSKKLKNLKKRLREIEVLEDKLKTGKAKPDPDQLTKLKRKQDLLNEIYQLEKST